MSVEDKQLAIRARHAMARLPIDISEVIITASRGMVEINGKVKKLTKGGGEISLRKEFLRGVEVVRTIPGVKNVVAERVYIMD